MTPMALNKGNILIVDDDPYIILSLQTLLEQHYTNIRTLKNPEGIPGHLNEQQFDVILLDMNFKPGDTSGEEGMLWLRRIFEEDPHVSIILITAYGGVNIAVEAIKEGAVDFVVKPWQNEKLLSTVSAAFRLSRSKREVDRHKSRERILSSALEDQYLNFIGESESMRAVMAQVAKVAGTNANVLILGENGTGKTTLAYLVMGVNNYKPTGGRVIFEGEDIADLSISQRAKKGISLAWQEPARIEGLRVRDYLKLSGNNFGIKQIEQCLLMVGMEPSQYLNRDIDNTLSGGERKRVELASILAMKPKLAILDEPDSGIDIVSLLESVRNRRE